jgi:hypothetical protein
MYADVANDRVATRASGTRTVFRSEIYVGGGCLTRVGDESCRQAIEERSSRVTQWTCAAKDFHSSPGGCKDIFRFLIIQKHFCHALPRYSPLQLQVAPFPESGGEERLDSEFR